MSGALAIFALHGGALDEARRVFPSAPEPWIDLSTGINPVAYPVGAVGDAAWMRLPETSALETLERVASVRYRAAAGLSIVAAPGTQSIIQRLPALYGGNDVRVLGRTYGEYERVFGDGGAMVRRAPTLAALAGADVAVVVNPNNPDGRLVAPVDLVRLAGSVGALIVDEAFMDPLPAEGSLAGSVPHSRTIVLRSFGKMYGLAGLRLGFAIMPRDEAEALRRMLGPWPVSGPAIAIATKALADVVWLEESTHRLTKDCRRLRCLLGRADATPVGGTPLFCLAAHPAAPALFTALGKAGILVRRFADEPCWLRFGMPRDQMQWTRLEAAIDAFG